MSTYAELLAWVEERVVEKDGCWIWKLSSKNGVLPQGKYAGAMLNVRRELVRATAKKPLPAGWVAHCKCDDQRCVRPEHQKATTRSEILSGRTLSPGHKAAVSKSKAAKSRLSDESVRAIRYGTGTIRARAIEHGISETYAQHIVHGVARKEYGSPFAGLGAR